MKYYAELKQLLDNYAQSPAHREELYALALEVIYQNCPAVCAKQTQSTPQASASDHRESETKQ